MPTRASKLCSKCSSLAFRQGMCMKHYKEYRAKQEQDRDNKWLYLYHDRRWLELRAQQLADEPLCINCKIQHRLTPATVADHVIPHKGDPKLFFDLDNLQSLCKPCHDRKTSREDGGFGNKKRFEPGSTP